MKKILSKIGLFRWYSICSIHRKYNPKCNCCRAGNWAIARWLSWDHYLWKLSPDLWRKWANRKRKKKMSERFIDRETKEKVNPFPNLK